MDQGFFLKLISDTVLLGRLVYFHFIFIKKLSLNNFPLGKLIYCEFAERKRKTMKEIEPIMLLIRICALFGYRSSLNLLLTMILHLPTVKTLSYMNKKNL